MNDWDNLDNFPADDDNDDFDWLNDDSDDVDSSADDDLAWLSDSDDEDENNTEEPAEPDVPDWLSGMELPDVSEEDIVAAQESISASNEADDDDWGISDDDDLWGSVSEEDSDNTDDGWGLSDSFNEPEPESEGDSWLASTDDDTDDADDFLFGASSDDEDDADDFLFGAGSDDEDDADDFLFGAGSDDEDDADDFLFGASSDDEDDADDFLFGAGSDDEDDVDDFLFGAGSDDTTPVEASESQDSEAWGDLGDFDFDSNESYEEEVVAEDSGWDLSDSEDDFAFMDETSSESTSRDDDLGVPDWLSDMPVPGEDLPEEMPVDDDLGVPDWLSDMPVPGEDEPEETPIDDDLGIPDWLDIEEPVAESAGDDLMDLLGDFDEEPVAESSGDDLLDLLGDFDDSADSADLSDLLASLDDGDDGDLDDLLSSLDTSDDDAGLDDLFASLDDSSSDSDDLDFFESVAEESDDLDFFEPVAEESDDLDFFEPMAEEGDDLDFFEPVAEESDDLDFFEPVAEESDDLDFFEPVAEESDDLDFLEDEMPVAGESSLDFMDFEDEDSDSLDAVAEANNDLDFLNFKDEDSEDEDDELALLNLLNRKKTSELDFMAGISRGESLADETQPEIDDDELAILNQLSKRKTSELDFMADISRDEAEPAFERDDEELENLNKISKSSSDEFDFMDDIFHDAPNHQTVGQDDFSFDDDFETGDDVQAWFDSQDTPDDEPVTNAFDFVDDADSEIDINDTPDWLDEISGIDTDTLKEASAKANEPEKVDIDSLIDSFDFDDEDEIIFNDEDEIAPGASLDAIFGDMDADEASDDLSSELLPDWLQEIQKGESAASAATLLRERENRSLDDLDDRLLDLRERGLEMSPDVSDAPENKQRLSKIVPNIDDALSPAPTKPGQLAITTAANISPEQAQRANLLQNLVGASLGAEAVEGLAGEDARPRQRRGSRLQSFVKRADRIVIALLLIAAVVAPFAYPVFDNIGILPAGKFAEDSPEFAAFTAIENLEPGEYVLVAIEYGATGARELDTATRTLLEHIITNGGIPVIVGSDAVGLLRAENILVELLGAGESNHGYYVAGFLPGGNIGLRDFATNVNLIVSNDLRGQPTGLNLSNLNEFSSIIIISESGEDVRNWMEQIAPITDTGIIVVTGQAARPLALPYVTASDNTIALLTSYEDAFTYQQMSLAIYNPSDTPTATATFTSTPTSTATSTATPLPTDTPTITPLPTDTPEPTETPLPTDTSEPTATDIPSLTPRSSNTPGGETNTPEASATLDSTAIPEASSASADSSLIEVALITSSAAANVRAGAGTDFGLVTTVAPGERLAVQQTSVDGEWYEVLLPDGSTGWLASILVDILELPANEFEGVFDPDINSIIQIGTVIGDGRVNVRSEPDSGSDAVAGLDPGSRVRIIGTSDAGDWYNIVLPNGGEGWIASFLMTVEEIPATNWEGASKDGFLPIYFGRPPEFGQSDDETDTLIIGRNASGLTMPVYSEDDSASDVLVQIPNGAEFIVIEEGDSLTQILLEDGQIGFFETRLIATEERARSDVDFAPTVTPTPLPPTVTPTFTPEPFVPQITPAPLIAAETRSSSQALGLVAAIAVIALGNLFWIFRWLGQREQ